MNQQRTSITQKAAAIVCAAAAFAVLAVGLWHGDSCTLTCLYPDGTSQTYRTLRGFSPWNLPRPVQDGWTFVGWQDDQGNLLSPGSVKPREDMTVTARMAPALNTGEHIAYLTPAEQDLFLPDAPLTAGQAEDMLDRLTLIEEEQTFFSQSPETPVDRQTFLTVLRKLYPADRMPAVLRDRADGPLTRGQSVQILNTLLNRNAGASHTQAQVGVLPDVPPDHPLYGDMAEAAVSHHCSGDSWTDSTPLPKPESGLRQVGLDLLCVGPDGPLVRSGNWGNFQFDAAGRYTSGMPELDDLVRQVLDEILTPDMTPLEQLRAAYDYTVSSFSYLRRNYYQVGETGWGAEEAYTMLSTGYGNCYSYAATFYELARALGFDPVLISGLVGTDRSPHGWVELELDGVHYTCDPELEMTYHRDRAYRVPDMFLMPDSMSAEWTYRH